MKNVHIIGAGLAGSEAAWYLANHGYHVVLHEMRPEVQTEAHHTNLFSELVCSNSLRSNSLQNGVGVLKEELRMLQSIVMESADKNSVEAGSALAVDRTEFATYITEKIQSHPNIEIRYEEITQFDLNTPTICTAGPLCSKKLFEYLKEIFQNNGMYFYDAAAPIISTDSIDFNKVYLKSRYDKGEASYLNCPMTKEEFDAFYDALITAECIEPKEFELKVFEGCMPVEIMAKRGRQTLLYGMMKPVGLEHDGVKPYAVVQLRRDNFEGSSYNIVGFQTHLKFPEQKRVFRMIPGLENAEFLRYGVMHKNIYLHSPSLLKQNYQSKMYPNLFFGGQITGVEGYVESAASGLYAAIALEEYLEHQKEFTFPRTTMIGAMSYYISHCTGDFQPSNANFGLLPMLTGKIKKAEKKEMYAQRALQDLKTFLEEE